MKKHLTFTIDSDIIAEIDEVRGLAARSTVVNHMLKQEFTRRKSEIGDLVN